MVEYYQKIGARILAPIFYEVKDANKDKIGKKVTGTYVPKELILDIASWVSIEFYDKCNRIVVDYFVEETRSKMEQLRIELQAKDTELQTKDKQHKAELQAKDTELQAKEDQLLALPPPKRHAHRRPKA